jgi:hypothetical protein
LLKLFRHLHESVHTLSAENAHLKAALKAGAVPVLPDVPTVVERVAINPSEADITPPSELGTDCFAGPPRPGCDDHRARRSTQVIDVDVPKSPKPPTARPPQTWDDTAGGKAWQAWHDAGGNGGGDPWANNNR